MLVKISLYLVGASLLAASPDFSGAWSMDPQRSESAHQDVPIGPVTVTIRQTATDITIETTRAARNGSTPFHETLTYKLDGSETSATGDGGVQVVTKAHWEGEKLIAETTRNVRDSTVTTSYSHRLDASGSEMTVEKTLNVQHGYQGQTAQTTGRGTDVFVKKDR